MKISFRCNGCGKSYSVKPELAGRKAKCRNCNQVMLVPQPAPPEPEPVVAIAEIVEAEEHFPVATPAPLPTPTAPTTPEPSDVLHGTLASNPGHVAVNKLKYISSYPKWFWIWHGGLLLSLALCFVSLLFVLGVMFFAFCCYMYWKRITTQFRSGCTNPAQVISIDPPLVATMTNLTKGLIDADVIKICPEPLGKFSTGMPALGQKLATIALYEDDFCDDSGHWSSFDPRRVNLVTKDVSAIGRVVASVEQKSWQELSAGLAQLSQPYQPGHYRVYTPADFAARPRPNADQIKQIVSSTLQGMNEYGVHLFNELTQHQLMTIAHFVPEEAIRVTWGIIDGIGSECEKGFVFTDIGVFFNFDDSGAGRFGYKDLVGALSTSTGLELSLIHI